MNNIFIKLISNIRDKVILALRKNKFLLKILLRRE